MSSVARGQGRFQRDGGRILLLANARIRLPRSGPVRLGFAACRAIRKPPFPSRPRCIGMMEHEADTLPIPATRLMRSGWMLASLGLWCLVAFAAGVKSLLQPWTHTVYPCFYLSSLGWWSGESMYAATGYQYTPTFAIANTPFALCGISAGAVLFNLASMALLFVAVICFARHVLPGHWSSRGISVLLSLTLAGALRGIWANQSNALVIGLVLLAAVAVVRKRWWAGGLLLAAPVFIKLWPIAAAMLMIACWPRKLWWRFGVAMEGLAIVPFLTASPQYVFWQFGEYAKRLDYVEGARFGGYRDAWTIVEQLVEPNRHAFLAAQLLGALVVLAFCLWRRLRAPSERQAMTALVGAWVAWQLLLGPGSERLTYGILAPLASWAVIESFAQGRRRTLALAAWTFSTVLGAGVVERLIAPYVFGAPAIQPLGVAIFAVWLIAHECDRSLKPVETGGQAAGSAIHRRKTKHNKSPVPQFQQAQQ